MEKAEEIIAHMELLQEYRLQTSLRRKNMAIVAKFIRKFISISIFFIRKLN